MAFLGLLNTIDNFSQPSSIYSLPEGKALTSLDSGPDKSLSQQNVMYSPLATVYHHIAKENVTKEVSRTRKGDGMVDFPPSPSFFGHTFYRVQFFVAGGQMDELIFRSTTLNKKTPHSIGSLHSMTHHCVPSPSNFSKLKFQISRTVHVQRIADSGISASQIYRETTKQKAFPRSKWGENNTEFSATWTWHSKKVLCENLKRLK